MERRDYILKLIVEHFIKYAQPVGSKTLIDEYHLTYSSATIRNEMLALEKDNFIEKTHTSSGRVPSEKGYRYYIANLREKSVSEEIKHSLQTIIQEKAQSVEEVIEKSCQIITQMTDLVSVVLGPNESKEKLLSVQMIPLGDKSVTAVFVTDKGYVENKTFVLEKDVSAEDIQECVKLINERITGSPVSQLVSKIEALKPILSDYIIEHDIVYKALLETFLRFTGDRLETFGKEKLLNHPEFKNNTEKLKKVISLLDSPEKIKKVLSSSFKDDDVSISFGTNENDEDLAFVSTEISVGDENKGTISLIGPKRMDYQTVVNALSFFAKEIQNAYKDKGTESSPKSNKKMN